MLKAVLKYILIFSIYHASNAQSPLLDLQRSYDLYYSAEPHMIDSTIRSDSIMTLWFDTWKSRSSEFIDSVSKFRSPDQVLVNQIYEDLLDGLLELYYKHDNVIDGSSRRFILPATTMVKIEGQGCFKLCVLPDWIESDSVLVLTNEYELVLNQFLGNSITKDWILGPYQLNTREEMKYIFLKKYLPLYYVLEDSIVTNRFESRPFLKKIYIQENRKRVTLFVVFGESRVNPSIRVIKMVRRKKWKIKNKKELSRIIELTNKALIPVLNQNSRN